MLIPETASSLPKQKVLPCDDLLFRTVLLLQWSCCWRGPSILGTHPKRLRLLNLRFRVYTDKPKAGT
jgi:hypothetical protein